MGSVIDGEDVVQDTFARAFAALNQLEEDQPIRAWLFRIAHNRAWTFCAAAQFAPPSRSKRPTRWPIRRVQIPWR